MVKGSRRCLVCRKQATGHLLHIRGRNMKRYYGSPGCQEHLEEAVERDLKAMLRLPDLLLLAARNQLPPIRYYRPMGDPVGKA